jgi:hypothetical protein
MNMIVQPPRESLRRDPQLRTLFADLSGEAFDADQQALYERIVPDEQHRMAAARDVWRHEELVARATVNEILDLYPFREYHDRGPEKCIRDVVYVSRYATQAMLLRDTDWYRDKFLHWMRTMIQAFDFPARDPERTTSHGNPHPEITTEADRLPSNVASIHDTYARLRIKYAEILQPEHFELMDVPLQTAVDVLTITH